MKEIGAVFRQIRESRHISLEEATVANFRAPCYLDLKEEKMTWRRNGFSGFATDQTSLSEFSHLAGIDQRSFIPKLLKEHYENMSLEHDQALYQSYQQAYQKYQKKKTS